MDTNKYFSFARIGLVMKRDLMENWKNNLYLFLGIFAAYLVVYLFCMADDYGSLNGYINAHSSSFSGITVCLLVYSAAEMMRNMRTKEARLSYLMLPATSLEKFVSRALYVTVGLTLMIVVASLLAEAVHWVFMPFFDELPDEYKICVWPEAWGKMCELINPFQTRSVLVNYDATTDPATWQWVEKSAFPIFMMGYMASLWQHSVFVLGGNYFGKHPFLKTIATMIVVGMLVAWIAAHIHWDAIDYRWIGEFIEVKMLGLTEEMVAGFISFVFFSFTALNWWLSYRLFTRQQVIKPKFRLL